jgi:hypothetical protein
MRLYACLPASDSLSLAACRTQAGWEVCTEDDHVWVRATEPDVALWLSLPFTGRYTVDSGNRLVRAGQSVPSRRIPDAEWSALERWMPVSRPTSLPGGVRPMPVAIKPIRLKSEAHESDLLVTSIETWEKWALTAPLARLDPLRFAASSDGRICVKGWPLPPIPGEAWVLHQNIALRAGFGFPPFCVPRWLASLFRLPSDSLAFWHENGTHEIVPSSTFIPASRSNVRASVEAIKNAE